MAFEVEDLHLIPNGSLPDAPRDEEACNPLGHTFEPPRTISALIPETHCLERHEDLCSEFNSHAAGPVADAEKKRWEIAKKPQFPCVYEKYMIKNNGKALVLCVKRVENATRNVIATHGYHDEHDGDTVERRRQENRGFYEVGGVVSKDEVEELYMETLLKPGNSKVASWMRLIGEDNKTIVEVRYRRRDGMGNKLVLGIGKIGEGRVEFDAERLLCDELVRVGILVFDKKIWWYVNGALIRKVSISNSLGNMKISFGRDGEFHAVVDGGLMNPDERREFLVHYVRVWEVKKKRARSGILRGGGKHRYAI